MHDYLAALIGGGMIGVAAIMVMASHGRIMGVSGIVSNLLPPVAENWLSENAWRLAFLAGVLTAPLLFIAVRGNAPTVQLEASAPLLIASGLIVGVGTVTGNGCTSGHGVCGLARMSGRSLAATVTFMVTAIVTVLAVRLLGLGGAL